MSDLDLQGGDAAAAAAKPVPAAAAPKLRKGIVANGNTVVAGDDGKHHGPGAEVSVSAEEHAALTARGVLVDPAAEAELAPDGASLETAEGPTIRQAATPRRRAR